MLRYSDKGGLEENTTLFTVKYYLYCFRAVSLQTLSAFKLGHCLFDLISFKINVIMYFFSSFK